MLDQFISEGLKGKSEATAKSYRQQLKKFEEYLQGVEADLNNFARVDVQQYVDYLTGQGKEPATINLAINAIKKYARHTGREEAVKDLYLPKENKNHTQAPQSLSKLQRQRLLREVDRKENKRNKAIIQLLLRTGLRVSELVALDRQDVEISQRKGSVTVRNGKGYKYRTVPLDKEARRYLQDYLDERRDGQDPLFLSNRDRRISVRTVQEVLSRYEIGPHQLRHTFIKNLVDAGTSYATIQNLTGHESIEMIARYSQPDQEDLESAIENNLYRD